MRYLPHTPEDIDAMLTAIGVDTVEDLFDGIPEDCCCRMGMSLPAPISEWELNAHMDTLAATMATRPEYAVFLGAGSYDHHIPEVVNTLKSRSEFVTSYTPYQPEISQGTLQAIYEYQTMAARLMGMDVATASHYDGATALAEALLMAVRKTGRKTVAVSSAIHPHYRQVVRTYFHPTGCEVLELPWSDDGRTDINAIDMLEKPAAVALQSPNFFGCIEDLTTAADRAHGLDALFITGFTEAVAYGLLKSPGSQGADIVCGEGQSLGLPQAFGGPGLGMLGSRQAYVRSLPGRLVGKTTDVDGKAGFVLTLATREQHIRREKATSNICTNNGHCALTAAIFMAALGGTGFHELAALNHDKAAHLNDLLAEAGVSMRFTAPYFNEFVIQLPAGSSDVHDRLRDKKIIAGLPLESFYPELSDCYLLCATETTTVEQMKALAKEVTS